jgi:hypothetical protein
MSTVIPAVGLMRDQYHRYSWNGDGPLVGVTTPLKIQDTLIGGDLASWGGGIVADYLVEHPGASREEALAKVSAARDIGTAVHARIEHILLGDTPESPCPRHLPEFGRIACQLLPDQVPPYIYAFSSFLAAYRPEFVQVEAMIVNLTHRYAGTFDIAARMAPYGMVGGGKRLALIDVKTGKAKVSQRLQLAGYAAGEFIGRPDDPERYPIPKFQDYYILLLRPDGYELVQQDVTRADKQHFLSLVKTYRKLRQWQEDAAA